VLFLRAATVDGSVDEETRTVRFVASTEDIDGHGTIVRQNWRLDRFKPSGVVLYAHEHDELPIGTATVSVEAGALRADVTFSTEDLNPKAEAVWRNVKAGTIRGISPGFQPHSITFERHDDREVMVLDDNELFELSVTPCPSNAMALAEMRSMHATPPTEPPQSPPPAAGPAVTEPQPSKEDRHMADDKKTPETPPMNVISILRALELPAGATETDGVNAAIRLRQLEVAVQALTKTPSTAEGLGALRAMAANAEKYEAAAAELVAVKAERDAQNIDALLAQGRAESKLSPAEEKFERDQFAIAAKEGRGADAVNRLRGYLAVKAPDVRFSRSVSQPSGSAGAGTPLAWNGKSYGELKHAQRAALQRENPELWKLMKADHESTGAAA
jgi:HK97 family phage prohead protease